MSSTFTLDPTGEKFAFARFRGGGASDEAVGGGSRLGRGDSRACDQGATELADMQSNGEAAQRKTDDVSSKDTGDFYPTEDHVHTGSELKNDRNQISAWQAGWNVTNAIQVK